MINPADEETMGIIRLRKIMRGWRPAVFTLIVISVIIFQLTVSRNTEATAGKGSQVLVSEPATEPAVPVLTENTDTFIRSGSTLSSHLEGNGISSTDSAAVIDAVKDVINLRRLRAGQKVVLHYENKYFAGITIPVSIDKDVRVNRSDSSGFEVEEVFQELQIYPVSLKATVDSSLYASCLDSGIQENIIMDLIQLYSFDVDFQRDIQPGDELTVTYEVFYDEDGNAVDTGNILFTTLHTGGEEYPIFRFEKSDGRIDFYNREGQTVRKTLLKTPINGAYITSAFGYRKHPISGYNKMHKGVDFGAPRGTPIKTAGDGTIVFAGYNEIYGNHVIIRHVNAYQSLYAHMSAFGRGIRSGRRVDQGQVIGYVGSTGMSTGPHLHYEVRYNGRQVNPSTMKFPPGHTLDGEEARLYRNMLSSYRSSLP